MILHLGGIVMRTDDSYTQKFTKQVVPPTRRYFHPLYRGTWFPTGKEWNARAYVFVSIRYIAVLGFQLEAKWGKINSPSSFHPLYRGTWFPTIAYQLWLVSNESFHPLYRGTWFPTLKLANFANDSVVSIRYIAVLGFQPIVLFGRLLCVFCVSIRYIAVLGFQPYLKNAPSDQRRRKRFTHPPSNRSHSHICFLKSR